jgi:hypothetical protein
MCFSTVSSWYPARPRSSDSPVFETGDPRYSWINEVPSSQPHQPLVPARGQGSAKFGGVEVRKRLTCRVLSCPGQVPARARACRGAGRALPACDHVVAPAQRGSGAHHARTRAASQVSASGALSSTVMWPASGTIRDSAAGQADVSLGDHARQPTVHVHQGACRPADQATATGRIAATKSTVRGKTKDFMDSTAVPRPALCKSRRTGTALA